MDENLVGYLLNALEPEEHRAVAAYLEANPDAQKKLELLRHCLEPLAADRDESESPRDLTLRTLAAVAEYRCRPLPHAPKTMRMQTATAGRRWWGRADVLVAAGLMVTVLSFGPSTFTHLRQRSQRVGCEENLRTFHEALIGYSQNHNDYFPNVANEPSPRNVAGMFVPALNQAVGREKLMNVRCPSNGDPHLSRYSMHDLREMTMEQFNQEAPKLAGCYAYSLGYRDDQGNIRSLRRANHGHLPIIADRPPRDLQGNSPNHGGKGQNVLFVDGNVRYVTHPNVGVDGDHIYLNKHNKVAVGVDENDTVLGGSDARPSDDD